MTAEATHLFDGQQRTIKEIMAMVPAIKTKATVLRHLSEGRNTRMAMLTYDPYCAAANASRRHHEKMGKPAVISGHVSRGGVRK